MTAFALAGSLGGAAAQYFPPQPPPVYGSPSYPPPPQSYPLAPLPPPDNGAQAVQPPRTQFGGAPDSYRNAEEAPYDPRYDRQAGPGAGVSPQPMPSLNGEPTPRPPSDVSGGAAPTDITGTVPAPAGTVPGAGPGAVPAAAPGQGPDRAAVIAALPPEDQPEQGPPKELPPQFRRQLVDYQTKEPAGTIIIDTPNTYLYLTLGSGKAIRYGIGVGREGFTWSGSERVRRMSEWPDWFPPKEMIERQPYLPRFMAGGPTNPLGARALYLGNTLYRIHGTNQPSTIGTFVSSGCIRLTNADIEDLYDRVTVGTRVVVLPGALPTTASTQSPTPQ